MLVQAQKEAAAAKEEARLATAEKARKASHTTLYLKLLCAGQCFSALRMLMLWGRWMMVGPGC